MCVHVDYHWSTCAELSSFRSYILMITSSWFFQSGGDCMVLPSVSKEDATKLFPKHEVKAVPSGKGYIRVTPQPQ